MPDFLTCGEHHRPDSMALCTRSGMQGGMGLDPSVLGVTWGPVTVHGAWFQCTGPGKGSAGCHSMILACAARY